jgi:hypothetical protein
MAGRLTINSWSNCGSDAANPPVITGSRGSVLTIGGLPPEVWSLPGLTESPSEQKQQTLASFCVSSEHAFPADPPISFQVRLGDSQRVSVDRKGARLVRAKVRRYVAAKYMCNPDTAFVIHDVRAEIRTIPARNTGLRIRISGRRSDVGRTTHDANRDVAVRCKNEQTNRLGPVGLDRCAALRCIDVTDQMPGPYQGISVAICAHSTGQETDNGQSKHTKRWGEAPHQLRRR